MHNYKYTLVDLLYESVEHTKKMIYIEFADCVI